MRPASIHCGSIHCGSIHCGIRYAQRGHVVIFYKKAVRRPPLQGTEGCVGFSPAHPVSLKGAHSHFWLCIDLPLQDPNGIDKMELPKVRRPSPSGDRGARVRLYFGVSAPYGGTPQWRLPTLTLFGRGLVIGFYHAGSLAAAPLGLDCSICLQTVAYNGTRHRARDTVDFLWEMGL